MSPHPGGSRPTTPTAVKVSSLSSGDEPQENGGNAAGSNATSDMNNNVDGPRNSNASVERAPLLTDQSKSTACSNCTGNGNGDCPQGSDAGVITRDEAVDNGLAAPTGNVVVRFVRSARHRCRCSR